MDSHEITFPLDKSTVSLIYLSEVYGIDLKVLLILYDKYGEDVFFFFFMFNKTRVEFPTPSKMQSIMNAATGFLEALHKGEIPLFASKQEEKVFSFLKSLYTEDNQERKLKLIVQIEGKDGPEQAN